ncbi:hypothetical protein [Mucilaginibacter sp. PAMB04168]|uniref:hypothetical protein n=1 Tax=Mucilaginibacter sp. PAMB04168 TaxID=3138567 RepID=UPI0031F626A7
MKRLKKKVFNMKKALLLLLLWPIALLGQDLEHTKFEMIKTSAKFLVTDIRISADVNYKINCSSDNYVCLESQLANKKFQGIVEKVRKWRQKTVKDKEDLQQLKALIWKDIISPQAKAYRLKLPGFPAYEHAMVTLVNVPVQGKQQSTPVLHKSQPSAVMVDSSQLPQADTVPESSAMAPETTSFQSSLSPIQKTSFMENIPPYFSIALSAIAIIISFFAVTKKPARSKQKEVRTFNYEPDISSIQRRIVELKEATETFRLKMLKDHEQFMKSVEDRLQEAASTGSKVVEWPIERKSDLPPLTLDGGQHSAEVEAPATVIRYAKYSDTRNGGFSLAIMRDQQNGEQTYQLEFLGEQATYAITEDLKAQKYALQNYEYLANACEIRNQVQPNSRIVTVQKGTLSKDSDQSWVIVNRAIIEFR